MTDVLIKRIETDIQGEHEDKDRDWSDVSTSQGTQKIATTKPLEAEQEEWNRFFLTALRRNRLC